MHATSQTLIFLPVLTVVALTFVAFVKMAIARGAAVKAGQDPDFYRAHLGAPEPEAATAAARHWDNLFELPTLFYAACITAFVMGAVGLWTLIFAWSFAGARIVQSVVHMTTNNPGPRGLAFSLGAVFVLALWVDIALAVFAAI
ncbi:MAPEG family protein [Novosphingobium mangrovi (ex Huang et al. 2023)]|uniref:MAPEG family protein n=1 Tax=Novosphingobium mangrovi (ex Huang et al. 2023) TaxID=2976432 RepID=A0ABT2I0Q6_9SPHN|nr:MAPEG family protein [Novosphingobium mangrovi (ex Huang et al. 2023)]MCT2398380.1 MAPEG family protein [Novosphingobium mangrovi (ex Huang et al. 2023)]